MNQDYFSNCVWVYFLKRFTKMTQNKEKQAVPYCDTK